MAKAEKIKRLNLDMEGDEKEDLAQGGQTRGTGGEKGQS